MHRLTKRVQRIAANPNHRHRPFHMLLGGQDAVATRNFSAGFTQDAGTVQERTLSVEALTALGRRV
jgi:hypothetical protein